MIRVSGVTKTYPGGVTALAGVDLCRELGGAEFVIEADGRVRRRDSAVSAGDDAQRYALQALLISTIV